MRVLFIHHNADLYGASRSLLRLTSHLVKDGNHVITVLPYGGKLKDSLEKVRVTVKLQKSLALVDRNSFKTLNGILVFLLKIPVSLWKLCELIVRFRPDIVHSNTSVLLTPGIACKLLRTKHIYHVREFYSEFPGFWKLYQQYINFFSDRIICVSHAVADQFTNSIRRNKVSVIHNGFPIGEFQPVEESRIRAFKEQYNLDGYQLVGVLGRIKLIRKGQEFFVSAVAKIAHNYPETRFIIIGSPFPGNEEHARQLYQLIAKLSLKDKIIYTGEVSDIKAAYCALDIVVLPSGLPEPFAGVIIEAMAYGKPVIGTKLGGTVEQIENDITGILVHPSNTEELAKALAVLLSDEDLRHKMGKKGKEKYLKEFEFKYFYESINKLYNDYL